MQQLTELLKFDPIVLALFAGIFTWGMTALGASMIFLRKDPSRKFLDGMLGFAAGVMLAASCFSLLIPSIEMSSGGLLPNWLPATVGFLIGGLFLRLVDIVLPHLHIATGTNEIADCDGSPECQEHGHVMGKRDRAVPEGLKTAWHRTTLLILAITLHNIPEGLAVGVAFGAIAADMSSASLGGAIALAIGMGLQNFPEGMAVSFPLRRAGLSTGKSAWWGQFSGLVEPVAAVIGAAAVIVALPLLPYALAFAAGAMVYVVVEEVIPEAQHDEHNDHVTIALMIGFAVMMLLDVALG